ncbi:MAG: MerR family transcriptional regulator [Candidatus Cloacimonetes bacterium]|nr:MerR family transcriptional regulator [Candidatus Cloacimonadota bacterium]
MLTSAEQSKRVTIKEAETRTKIPQRTIRKYVKDFPMIPVSRGQHQTLLFDLAAMELLIYTQHLFKERIPKSTIANLIEKRVLPGKFKDDGEDTIVNLDIIDEHINSIYSKETDLEVEMLTPQQSTPEISISTPGTDLESVSAFKVISQKLYDTEKMLATHVNLVCENQNYLNTQKTILDCQSDEIEELKKLVDFEKDRNLASVKAIFDLQDRLNELEKPKSFFHKLTTFIGLT